MSNDELSNLIFQLRLLYRDIEEPIGYNNFRLVLIQMLINKIVVLFKIRVSERLYIHCEQSVV